MLPLRLHKISRFAARIGQIDHRWFCVDSDRILAFVSWIPTIWACDMVIHDSQKWAKKSRRNKTRKYFVQTNILIMNITWNVEWRLAQPPHIGFFIAGTKTAFAYHKLIPNSSRRFPLRISSQGIKNPLHTDFRGSGRPGSSHGYAISGHINAFQKLLQPPLNSPRKLSVRWFHFWSVN